MGKYVGIISAFLALGLVGASFAQPKSPGINSKIATSTAEVLTATPDCERVVVSTGTAKQVDLATTSGLMTARVWVRMTNHDSADSIAWGYTNAVSSDTANIGIGEFLTAGNSTTVSAVNNAFATIDIWAIAVDAAGAAGVVIRLCQLK